MFAWRLDAEPWSAFDSATSVTLLHLTAGVHRFEVRSRDAVGNEDPFPAVRDLRVTTVAISITTPRAGDAIPAGSVVVQGRIQSDGTEASVFVNGIAALSSGTAFALVLPTTPATSTLQADIRTASGATASHTISVTVIASGTARAFSVIPAAGTATLNAKFGLTGAVASRYELDADGDGHLDFSGTDLSAASFAYTRQGLYFPTLTAVDAQGAATTFRSAVQVSDAAAIAALFRAKWAAFRAALAVGDVEGALQFVVDGEKDHYRGVFVDLAAALPSVVSGLGEIHLVDAGDDIVEFVTVREEEGRRSVYFVYFTHDQDGLWKIVRM